MNSMRKQGGMTAIGWLIVLALVAFFVLITLKLSPVYLEYSKISSAVDSLQSEPGITRKNPAQVRTLLHRRFMINDIKTVTSDDAKVEIANDKLKVRIKYEVRTPMLGNIDVVTMFDKDLEVIGN